MKQSAPTRKRVVVARRIFPELVAELRGEFDVVDNQDDIADKLAGALKDADAALITSGERVGRRAAIVAVKPGSVR